METEGDGNKLTVDGAEYVRDNIRSFRLSLSDFEYGKGVRDVGEDLKTERFNGEAEIQKDRISVVGSSDEPATRISLALVPIEVDEENTNQSLWTAIIGFLEYDWEIGEPECYFVEAYVSRSAFDEFLADWRSGHVESLSLGLETDLYVKRPDEHAPPSASVTRYLPPEKLGVARGSVTELRWTDRKLPTPARASSTIAEAEERDDEQVDWSGQQVPNYKGVLQQIARTMGFVLAALVVIALVLALR